MNGPSRKGTKENDRARPSDSKRSAADERVGMLGNGRMLDLDCGIAYARIASWLDDELHLPYLDGRWLYRSESSFEQESEQETSTCTIVLEPLESRPLGTIALERSHLTAQGSPDALASFERLFTLRFISAGG